MGSGFDENADDDKEQGEMLLANDRKGLFYDFVGSPARGVRTRFYLYCIERSTFSLDSRCSRRCLLMPLLPCHDNRRSGSSQLLEIPANSSCLKFLKSFLEN